MGKALRLLFNLYPGEGRKASFFIILGLLWSIGSYGIFTLSEGMFLEHVGAAALPQSYFAIAATMCLFSTVLIFSLNRFSIRYLLFSLIALWILANLFFYFFLSHNSTPFWFIFKVIGWVIPLSTYIVYWAFVDQYYDLQDGKRFFCLFNSIIFLGDSIGGATISFFLKPLGMGGVILLFTASLALSLPFIFLITKSIQPVLEEHVEGIDSPTSLNFSSIVKTILNSRFTIYLLLFYFLMQLLAIVTEYNYMDSFERSFVNREANTITEFIGTCGMWISLGNMVLAMLLYGRLVKKLGVNNIILVAPSLFVAIFVGWFCKDALALAILGMVAREGLVYTFDDNNLNLLITGVPTKIKNQVRISVESFIEPFGMFFSAFLLLFLQKEGRGLGLILGFFALGLAVFLRKHYAKAIFRNLVASSIRFEKKSIEWLSKLSNKDRKQTEFLLLTNLKRHDEKEQLAAYEYLLKIGSTQMLSRVLNHIGKLTLPGKLRAIELLGESKWAKEAQVIERLDRWRRILPHPAIKSSIHFYFAKHGLLRPERVVHDLHNEHAGLRASAILSLKTSHHGLHLPSFYSTAVEKLGLLLDSKNEEEVVYGLKILELENNSENLIRLLPYLKSSSLSIQKAAAKALSALACPEKKEYAKEIVSCLSLIKETESRLYCLRAIEKFSNPEIVQDLILSRANFRSSEKKLVERIVFNMGKPLVGILLKILENNTYPERCRLLAGKILGKLDLKTLRAHLFKIVCVEIDRAYFYYYHAHTIQHQVPQQDLFILENALLTGYHTVIDFIIQLLGISGSIEECEVLSYTLRSKNRKIRAQAVESLEKASMGKIFALLEPLIDDRHSEEKLRLYLRKGRIPLNLTQLLDHLAHSPSLTDQIVSFGLKARLQTPRWHEELKEKLKNGDAIFHHFAHELLEPSVSV